MGAVCEWIFSQMCGIKVAEDNTYVVQPKVGGTITHACCQYNGIYGKVVSAWYRNDDKTTYKITVPANATVKAILPNGQYILTAGEHKFEVQSC